MFKHCTLLGNAFINKVTMIKSLRFMDAEEVEALTAMNEGESDGGEISPGSDQHLTAHLTAIQSLREKLD